MKRYITVEELRDLIINRVRRRFILKYWNLDYPGQSAEVLEGNAILTDDDINSEKIECYLDLEGGYPFPIDFKYNSGRIDRFNNDHYQFSLLVEYD